MGWEKAKPRSTTRKRKRKGGGTNREGYKNKMCALDEMRSMRHTGTNLRRLPLP